VDHRIENTELLQVLETMRFLKELNKELPTYSMTKEESEVSSKTFWKLFE
jgi:DUF4097 and DUF4098 domain-containing protein YvlB